MAWQEGRTERQGFPLQGRGADPSHGRAGKGDGGRQSQAPGLSPAPPGTAAVATVVAVPDLPILQHHRKDLADVLKPLQEKDRPRARPQ